MGSFLMDPRGRFSTKLIWRTTVVVILLILLSSWMRPAVHRLPDTLDPETVPQDKKAIDWSQYAYLQYATGEAYLCNSVMVFESLVRLRTKAERLLIYPSHWPIGGTTYKGGLLAKARDEFGVNLLPIEIQHFDGEKTWADSFTKLLAFNQTQYQRILSLDSDATVLQSMDELFLIPSTPVAAPKAYWLERSFLSSQLVLIEPSKTEFDRILNALKYRTDGEFDMEILNDLYGQTSSILPHRKYNLLTGEFQLRKHHKYFGNTGEHWEPEKAFLEAKFVHFSDYPYPKPWIKTVPIGSSSTDNFKPKCRKLGGGKLDCSDQERWLWFYTDFQERRLRVCDERYYIGV